MNYSEFVNEMENSLRNKLGTEVVVESYKTTKNNGTKRIGLVLKRADINMSPTIYLEEFYHQYQEGIQIEQLTQSIVQLYQKIKLEKSFPYEKAFDYQKIKENIVYKLVGYEQNKEFLKEVPFLHFLDMAILPYVLFEDTEFGTATLQIRNEHLQSWKVDKQEIFAMAKRNTPHLLPLELGRLTEYMYVMTNTSRSMGAAVVSYPDSLEKAYHLIGESYYVLPSSIHEMILIPESFGVNLEQLKVIVSEINETEVRAEEVLTNSVYFYNGGEKGLYIR